MNKRHDFNAALRAIPNSTISSCVDFMHRAAWAMDTRSRYCRSKTVLGRMDWRAKTANPCQARSTLKEFRRIHTSILSRLRVLSPHVFYIRSKVSPHSLWPAHVILSHVRPHYCKLWAGYLLGFPKIAFLRPLETITNESFSSLKLELMLDGNYLVNNE